VNAKIFSDMHGLQKRSKIICFCRTPITVSYPGGKAGGAWIWPLTSI